MKEARWYYKNSEMIRDDIKNALIGCIWKILHDTAESEGIKLAKSEGIKLAKLEGVWELYNAIIPNTEEMPDEDVQND